MTLFPVRWIKTFSRTPGNFIKSANQIRPCQIKKLLATFVQYDSESVNRLWMWRLRLMEMGTNSIFICVSHRCVFHRHPVFCVEGDSHHFGQLPAALHPQIPATTLLASELLQTDLLNPLLPHSPQSGLLSNH